jgi:hypothetical protein
MLPDTPDVEHALTGPDEPAGVQKRALVIDMSSISPVAIERLPRRSRQRRGDARRTGERRRDWRDQCDASIMVGGDEAAFNRARPIFEAMGNKERIVHIGKSGAGQSQGLQWSRSWRAGRGQRRFALARKLASMRRVSGQRCSADSPRARYSKCTVSEC